MKSYLNLIPISAKVHKRQNRMTLLCVIFAVFLVTTVFSMADMAIKSEAERMIVSDGNWHISLNNISESDADQVSSRDDVKAFSWSHKINDPEDPSDDYYNSEEEFRIGGKKTVLRGADENYSTEIRNSLTEGYYPQNEGEIMLSTNAKTVLDVDINDSVTVNTPAGDFDYVVSGFGEDGSMDVAQDYLIYAFLNREAYTEIYNFNLGRDPDPEYYIQFDGHKKISTSIADVKQQYDLTDENISENTGLLTMIGDSSSDSAKNIYPIAIVLFVLILIAGVLMISGSINSNVAQRTQFFGMMRCIGASRQQIIRFVRLEALNWCKTAIPIGVALGIVITWGMCAVLRFGIGGEFTEMPLFGVSAIGICSGVIVGIMTVLLAAQSPAKRAAKVSPVAAISGNAGSTHNVKHAANTSFNKIEIALGVHHAISAKKNLILMTGSFTLSIIMFLGFSAGLDLTHALIPSLRPWQPDCSILGYGNACTLEKGLVDEISEIPGVERAYGNIVAMDIPASSSKNIDGVTLISYEEYMLGCAKDDIVSGDVSKVYGDSDYVLTIYNKNNPLKVGDKIQLDTGEIEVAGAVSDGLFPDDVTVICSEETFIRLTGESDYAMIQIQLSDSATDQTLNAISDLANDEQIFSDMHENNQHLNSTFWAFRLFAYSFLLIIAMITVLNIINSTSMSVSAKIKQYGAMRAVGMDGKQLTKMIAAEVFTYALLGCVVGCVLGLVLNQFLFKRLVTTYLGVAWSLPVTEIIVILLIVIASAWAAIHAPSKRIRNMAVTDTINEL